jgi:hypothetical protein
MWISVGTKAINLDAARIIERRQVRGEEGVIAMITGEAEPVVLGTFESAEKANDFFEELVSRLPSPPPAKPKPKAPHPADEVGISALTVPPKKTPPPTRDVLRNRGRNS